MHLGNSLTLRAFEKREEMPHKLRKIRKKRGTRTVGYGRVGQHRGVGQRGGHGKAGRRKHLWTYVLRYEPDYFEKKGFKHPRRAKVKTINIGELDLVVTDLLKRGIITTESDGIHVNLKAIGYGKLLGSGRITHQLVVKADYYSKTAAEKIRKAKGRILQTQEKPNQRHVLRELSGVTAKTPICLIDVKGIGPKRAKRLRDTSIQTVKALIQRGAASVSEGAGVSKKIAVKWIENAKQLSAIQR